MFEFIKNIFRKEVEDIEQIRDWLELSFKEGNYSIKTNKVDTEYRPELSYLNFCLSANEYQLKLFQKREIVCNFGIVTVIRDYYNQTFYAAGMQCDSSMLSNELWRKIINYEMDVHRSWLVSDEEDCIENVKQAADALESCRQDNEKIYKQHEIIKKFLEDHAKP